MYTYAMGVLVSVRVLHYILATRVCKSWHVCVEFYTRVHARKISTHVFVFAVCVSHVDFVLHVWDMRVTHVQHA